MVQSLGVSVILCQSKTVFESIELGASETKSSDLIKALVSGKEAELETQAGVKVIGTYDETVGTLLDVLA